MNFWLEKPEKCTVREEFMRESRSRQVSALKSFQKKSFFGLNLYRIQNASFVVIIRMEASRCQFVEALGVWSQVGGLWKVN